MLLKTDRECDGVMPRAKRRRTECAEQKGAERYEDVSLIGTGAYGTVYKAKDLEHEGRLVALKKVRVPLTDEGVPLSTLREITLLKHLEAFDHPNVVRLLDICHGPRLPERGELVLYLVFEHVDHDLADYLDRRPELDAQHLKELLYQVCSGVDFLHSNRVVHRDLKPHNILVSALGNVKIADFGLARIFQDLVPLTSVVVTLWYRSPEVLLQSSYATAVDIWSIGCIFAELYRRQPLFRGESEVDQLRKIFEVLGVPKESEWPRNVALPWTTFSQYRDQQALDALVPSISTQGIDLLHRMLVFDPLKRVSAADAMGHPFFDTISGEARDALRARPRKSTGTEAGTS